MLFVKRELDDLIKEAKEISEDAYEGLLKSKVLKAKTDLLAHQTEVAYQKSDEAIQKITEKLDELTKLLEEDSDPK